jgi:hypothetical protein
MAKEDVITQDNFDKLLMALNHPVGPLSQSADKAAKTYAAIAADLRTVFE